MARKPALTDESFLASVFRPKSNPTPSGLRHRSVVKTAGRTAARVRAFNKLDAAKQAILDRTGTRESYLRGQSTLADAKRTLRQTAVRLGIVKPVRVRGLNAIRLPPNALGTKVVEHLRVVMGKQVNPVTVFKGVKASEKVGREALRMTRKQILDFIHDDDNIVEYDGEEINPLWYK